MQIFSGSGSALLAARLYHESGIPCGTVETTIFANGETRVWVREKQISGPAVIIQSLSEPVDRRIIEFALLADAVARMGASPIVAVIPWLAYSKQDKVFRSGEPLSVKVVAKILQSAVPLKRLITIDLHNPAILGFFDIPVVNLTARPLFEEYFQLRKKNTTVVVAPDAGSVKSSSSFAETLGVPICYLDKKRDLTTGRITVSGMTRSVENADIIIIDDLIVTGGTIAEATKFLKGKGAKTVTVAATHHLYVDGAQDAIEASGVDEVVVTDTVEKKDIRTNRKAKK